MNTTYLSNLYCYVCKYEWFPRTPKTPKICPRCKSPNWAEPLFVLGDPLRYFSVVRFPSGVYRFGSTKDAQSEALEKAGLSADHRAIIEVRVRRSEGYRVLKEIAEKFKGRILKKEYCWFDPEDLETIKEILKEGNFGEGIRAATIEKAPTEEAS